MRPRTPSFRVIEGGGNPVARQPAPSVAAQITAVALVVGVLGIAAWVAATAWWVRP